MTTVQVLQELYFKLWELRETQHKALELEALTGKPHTSHLYCAGLDTALAVIKERAFREEQIEQAQDLDHQPPLPELA